MKKFIYLLILIAFSSCGKLSRVQQFEIPKDKDIFIKVSDNLYYNPIRRIYVRSENDAKIIMNGKWMNN